MCPSLAQNGSYLTGHYSCVRTMARASRSKQAADGAAPVDAFEAAFGAINEEAAEPSTTVPPPPS